MIECPQDLLGEAARIAGEDPVRGLARVDQLLQDHGGDSRLHFLRGSLLAGLKAYGEAEAAMARAVEIAPQFALARFQWGLLNLTSGEAAAADSIWRPLDDLAADNPLRLFAEGLRRMMADEFPQAIGLLEQGIALNRENPPLNADMQLIIATLRGAPSGPSGPEVTSSAQILLQQFGRKPTKH